MGNITRFRFGRMTDTRVLLLIGLALLAVGVISLLYERYISPTRIAMVNYQGFQAAKVINAMDVGWVEVERYAGTDYQKLNSYDFVMIFGRGLRLSEQQLADLKQVSAKRMVIVDAPMNPGHSINSVPELHKSRISAYINNAGERNYQNLLRYIRTAIQGKKFATEPPEEPVDIAADVLFHLGPTAIFNDLESYREYYAQTPGFSSSGKKIALLTSVPGPFNANRDHIDALIKALEGEGYRVYPLASASRRLELLQAIDPELVIFMPHGRLHLGESSQAIEWLEQQNIPVIAPVSVFKRYEDWLQDPQGYEGSLLSMNVVLPELDGAIAPFVLNAQFQDDSGSEIFKIVPGRLNRFLQLVNSYLELKSTNNSEKRVGIVYFRGPGKNALTAGNMEVAESLYNTLLSLREQGYDLAGLPGTFEGFQSQLNRQGTVMTPRASGQSQRFLTEADPAFISVGLYREWCLALAEGLCQEVEAMYGAAPGDYLVDQNRGVAVARLQYGNIAIMPQPLPGYGSNTFKLVHGTDKAPPHTYLAAYFWLRNVFEADAVVHFGTHGSLEFTPSKQVALSDADWSDALLGGIPHFYVYTMSNVGEAIIAKRRSYAAIVNHLTPPFSRAGLTSELSVLQRALQSYNTTRGAVREESRLDINRQIVALNLDSDLGLQIQMLQDQSNWDEQVYRPLSEWLETISEEKITQGLYMLGQPYSGEEALQTVRLMFQDSLASHLSALAGWVGDSGPSLRSDIAEDLIDQAMAGVDPEGLVVRSVGEELYRDVQAWKMAHPTVSDMDIVRGFVALGKPDARPDNSDTAALTDTQLQEILVRVMADPEARAFLAGLENETSFSHVSKVLNPTARQRAQALSKVIPAIGEALEQLSKPDVETLVTSMQDPGQRQKLFAWMKSDDFVAEVEAARQRHSQILAREASEEIGSIDLDMSSEVFGSLTWQQQERHIESISRFVERYLTQQESIEAVTSAIEDHSGMSPQAYLSQARAAQGRYSNIYQRVSSRYREFGSRIGAIEQLISVIPHSKEYLINSTGYELKALLNGLAGGYVPPAAGGDPVLNPSALPTGRNMYAIDAEKTPSESAWKVGVAMAQELIESYTENNGEFPQKVAFTLWPSSFIHSQGATIAEILYLLGVEPVRDPFGRIQSLRLISEQTLGRPRIDVVVQSAGQLRDLAASRLALIEEAVVLAAGAEDDAGNFVRDGVRAAEKYLLAQGQAPLVAKTLSVRRSFGGVNNSYGTGIMELVESSHDWGSQDDIAQQYLQNMGAIYGESATWGQYNQSLFAAALQNTSVIVQPRSSNTWGALSLDHVYEFMGGLSAAVNQVTGLLPEAYFNDFRNSAKASVTPLEDTIRLEARTSLLNPKYIEALTIDGGASSAETFAETFRNTFGWNSMRPESIDEALWEQLHQVYVEDIHDLGLHRFFADKNPYALQEMTGVMLEASRKGFWIPSEQELSVLANLHADLVSEYEAGCGNFTCGNPALRTYIENLLEGPLLENYVSELDSAEIGEDAVQSIVLVEKENTVSVDKEDSPGDAKRPENQLKEKGPSDNSPGQFQLSAPVIGLGLFLLLLTLSWLWRLRGRR